MLDEGPKRLPQQFPAEGIIGNGNRIGLLAQQLKGDARFVDERRAHRFQDQLQRGLGSTCSRRGVEKSDWLPGKILASYQPIQHVLEGPRDAACIFRTRNQQAISLTHSSTQIDNAVWKARFEVRIKVR